MKFLLSAAFMLLLFANVNAQEIGEFAPEKDPIIFPNNAYGLDIMFSEGGFGLGGFYRTQLSGKLTMFVDLSISESKDEREFEYIDYWGNTFTYNKKNRIFLLPLNFGLQYRLFEGVIHDNLRPYINGGFGPTLAITTPYSKEFFSSFGDAKTKLAAGAYVGIGANFGIDKSSLVGINFRYYFIHFFDEGVESLNNRFKKDLGGFYLTLNIGLMY